MTDCDLYNIAYDFRVGLLGEGSPEGHCFTVSAPLSSLLRGIYGIDCELVSTDHSENPNSCWYEHYWIKLPDGRVLDPTFDQFCSEEVVPVYIGPPTEFHTGGPHQ